MTANAWAMQFLADICKIPVERPAFQEMTALGAAKLAALGAGLAAGLDVGGAAGQRWSPAMDDRTRTGLLSGWRAALGGALAVARGAGNA